jgi:serine/threonine-protein kinase
VQGVDALIGRRLGGRYRVVRRLDAGAMGVVYEAVQEDLGRRVALKLLTTAFDEAALERLRREAEAAARLGHPHIVQVTDFVRMPDEPVFLVMELLSGRSLAAAIELEAPMPVARVARIGLQLLDALGAAHAAKIVHRDIKPANVFLVSSLAVPDMVKVLDFGIAKLLDTEPGERAVTRQGAVIGTLAYMSPEQARGDAIDERADLYAAGVCLYEAASGARPIDAPVTALRAAILAMPPVELAARLPNVDPAFAAVVMRALEKDRTRRFASAREMAAALAPIAGVDALAPPETVRLRRPVEPDAATRTSGAVVTSASATVSVAGGSVGATRALTVPPRHGPSAAPRAHASAPVPRPRVGWSAGEIVTVASTVIVIVVIIGLFLGGAALNAVQEQKRAWDGGTTVASLPPADASAVRPAWFDTWEQSIRRSEWRITSTTLAERETALDPWVVTYFVSRENVDGRIVLYDYGPGGEQRARVSAIGAERGDTAAWNEGPRVAIALTGYDAETAHALLTAVTPR